MNAAAAAFVSEWVQRLRRVCGSYGDASLLNPETIAAFRDEAGNRRASDTPFLLWRARLDASDAQRRVSSASRDDARLWWALHDARIDVDAMLAPTAASEAKGMIELSPPMITASGAGVAAIEVFTQTQLSAMHALHRLARLRGRDDWRRHAVAAAWWFIEHIQPDNATNHPWGIGVFIEAAAEAMARGDERRAGEANFYAQTLLHNCRVTLGRPDALSAHVLADAAEGLATARGAT